MGETLIELKEDICHPNIVCVKVRCSGCGRYMGFIVDKERDRTYYITIADTISEKGWEFNEIEMYCPTCRALEKL